MTNKKIIVIVNILMASMMLIGGAYAFFRYYQEGKKELKLISGGVYLYFNDGNDTITMCNDIFPETPEKARGTESNPRTDNIITFTIEGKNDTKDQDLWYEIRLLHSFDYEDKKRFNDSDLRFDLLETIDGVSTLVLDNVGYDTINNKRIWINTIEKNTNKNIKVTYQLRVWLSDDVLISDTNLNASYTTGEYSNSFASVKVEVIGDFNEKKLPSLYEELEYKLALHLLEDDGDMRIVSGSNTDENLNNYIWYSGLLWRIVGLNNDKTIKLITDEQISIIPWGSNTTYEGSWIYQWLNEDFLDTLYNKENIIKTNSLWNATQVSSFDKPPKDTLVESPIGLLSAYEYAQSYARVTNYEKAYLNNGNTWWLLNPKTSTAVYTVFHNGAMSAIPSTGISNGIWMGVRPSINLKEGIKFKNGDGSFKNPYRISGDIEKAIGNVTTLSSRTSGEYVNFNGELYRIVEQLEGKTKITMVNFLKENDEIVTKYLSVGDFYGVDSFNENDNYWGYYLNNIWKLTLDYQYECMLVSGTWYISPLGLAESYKKVTCVDGNTTQTTKECEKTTNVYNGYIGLGRIGELFTSQLKNEDGIFDSMWTITPLQESTWYLSAEGITGAFEPQINKLPIRPSMYLSDDVIITSGSGTMKHPFEIAMPLS